MDSDPLPTLFQLQFSAFPDKSKLDNYLWLVFSFSFSLCIMAVVLTAGLYNKLFFSLMHSP